MDHIYSEHFYLGTSPVTVVGERYGRVYYVEGHHSLGEMDSDQFRRSSRKPDPLCGDVSGIHVCSLPAGHETSHRATALGGSISWGGWQGCLCDEPNTQAKQCPLHGNSLPRTTKGSL